MGGRSTKAVEWVFAGDVPALDQAELREEMEAVRAFFADQYGVSATGFRVLVGADSEALDRVYREVVDPAGIPWSPIGIQVAIAKDGSAALWIDFGNEGLRFYGEEALSIAKHTLAHEYFHVLQGQLTSLPDGRTDPDLGGGPYWLVEGLAEYADYVYTPSMPGRRPFFRRMTIKVCRIMTAGKVLTLICMMRSMCTG